MDSELPTVRLTLWRSDAVVLFDWLVSTDLETIPMRHPAEKQALTDLLTQLEADTDVAYGETGSGLTQDEIDVARAAVARDMGW